jgi:thiol-disulfide isomerase/thioredoxin
MQQSAVKLPTTALGTLEGGTTTLQAMAGKPMVLNLWATWCPPCRREMPVLARAQAGRQDVTFVFANQGESEALVREYLGDSDLELDNVLLDPFSTVMRDSGSRGLPTTLFFNADGRLVDTHIGELTDAGLAAKLLRFGPVPPASRRPPPQEPPADGWPATSSPIDSGASGTGISRVKTVWPGRER